MIDIKKFTISYNETARKALHQINELSIQNIAIFIVDEKLTLLGSVTDGDIRRGLLAGYNIDEPSVKFMNASAKYVVEGENNFEKATYFKDNDIRFVPVLDKESRIVNLLDFDEISTLIPADVVLMAGGKGERLKPLTNEIPKPMLKVGDKAIILRNIERLASFGVSKFHVSVRYMADKIESGILANKMDNIQVNFVKEDKPLGTIGSVKLIKEFSSDTIILMNSDLLTNIDFKDFYLKFLETNSDMQVATVPYHVDVPYAVMNISDNEEVLSFSEKPRYTYYSNAGIYIFKKELINLIPDNEVFDATDFMEKVIEHKKKFCSYPILGYWLDIGNHQDFAKAQHDVLHIKF